MRPERSLADLWLAASTDHRTFRPETLPALPESARRYLEHAVAPGTRLASAVRLRMHGQIKLGDWVPFTADQVIRRDRGVAWRATARHRGLPLHGAHHLVDGHEAQAWKLLGLVPVKGARSPLGRVPASSVWLPSLLCEPAVDWSEPEPGRLAARIGHPEDRADLALVVDAAGRVQSARVPSRDAEGDIGFRDDSFGGVFDREETFGGYTIPTRMRLGWHFGEPRFETDGEFLRATIDQAIFR